MTNIIDFTEWRIWTPIVSGYVLSMLCPTPRDEGSVLPQRPPSYMFGIVWPILYLLIGYSWMNSRKDRISDIMHGILTAFLCIWIVVYSCLNEKKYGMYVLACVVAITACCMCLHPDKGSKIALTPLLAWTILALQFNYHILDKPIEN